MGSLLGVVRVAVGGPAGRGAPGAALVGGKPHPGVGEGGARPVEESRLVCGPGPPRQSKR